MSFSVGTGLEARLDHSKGFLGQAFVEVWLDTRPLTRRAMYPLATLFTAA